MSLLYCSGNGNGHTCSPARSAAARTCSPQPSLLVIRPAIFSPNATTQAPVSVARSMIASGFASTASESPSARINRPSASVLSTSTVLPLRIFSTSPGRMAAPLGMFSTMGVNAITLALTPRSFNADIAPITAAAPPMSVFIVSMPEPVLSESPPESKTTPLPTRATVPRAPTGEYVILTSRGGLSEPCPTPTTPPSFARLSAAPSSTSTFTPLPRNNACADFAKSAGDCWAAGVLTASRAQIVASLTTRPRSIAALTAAPPLPITITRASCDGLESDFHSRYW